MTCRINSKSSTTFSSLRVLSLLVCIVFLHSKVVAQDFNYTATHDSIGWQELSSQTICNDSNSAWANSYRVAIGFPFTYLGRTFDTVQVTSNGYILFGEDDRYSFIAFNNFTDYRDDAGLNSVLGYERSAGVLKIQLKNVSRHFSQDAFSYQIWLHADGRVQLLTGPSAIMQDSSFYAHVGLLNRLMNTPNSGLLLQGYMHQPVSQPINQQNSGMPFMTLAPIAGHRYTFTPVSN
jgi:hypothetical protein